MLTIFLAIAPVFALIMMGYGLRRGGIPSTEFWNLNDRLVYWVLMPALFFAKISAADLSWWSGRLCDVALCRVLFRYPCRLVVRAENPGSAGQFAVAGQCAVQHLCRTCDRRGRFRRSWAAGRGAWLCPFGAGGECHGRNLDDEAIGRWWKIHLARADQEPIDLEHLSWGTFQSRGAERGAGSA